MGLKSDKMEKLVVIDIYNDEMNLDTFDGFDYSSKEDFLKDFEKAARENKKKFDPIRDEIRELEGKYIDDMEHGIEQDKDEINKKIMELYSKLDEGFVFCGINWETKNYFNDAEEFLPPKVFTLEEYWPKIKRN